MKGSKEYDLGYSFVKNETYPNLQEMEIILMGKSPNSKGAVITGITELNEADYISAGG